MCQYTKSAELRRPAEKTAAQRFSILQCGPGSLYNAAHRNERTSCDKDESVRTTLRRQGRLRGLYTSDLRNQEKHIRLDKKMRCFCSVGNANCATW